jgi:hypothetical protein
LQVSGDRARITHTSNGTRVKDRIPLIAAISAELFAIATAWFFVTGNNGFGSGDLPAMSIWSVPLALLVYLAFKGILRRFSRLSPLALYIILIIGGGALGFVTTALAVSLLGGAFFAFSFPVFVCWVLSGALAGLVAALLSAPSSWLAGVVAILVLCFGMAGLFDYASAPGQNIRVALQPGLSQDDQQRFWSEVIGTPGNKPTEHGMLDGISGASVAGQEKGSALFVVNLQRRLSSDDTDSILSRIRRSPLVKSAQLIAPNE